MEENNTTKFRPVDHNVITSMRARVRVLYRKFCRHIKKVHIQFIFVGFGVLAASAAGFVIYSTK